MMKTIEAIIMGQSYRLMCPEGGEASLLAAVSAVDREMCGIRDAGKVKARERIAVLAALNLAASLADRPAAVVPSATPRTPSNVDIDTLVKRIDQVLGGDGQLL